MLVESEHKAGQDDLCLGGFEFGGLDASGQHGQEYGLVERCLVLESGVEVDDVSRLDCCVSEGAGAGACGALAKAVPVVGVCDPGLVGVDDGAGDFALDEAFQPVGMGLPFVNAVRESNSMIVGERLGGSGLGHCGWYGAGRIP
ncbi:hypothetical protein [Arthrobacter sp. B3I9]|uniref:hypothetical protein n=1 Tax=Arthrobacter sp. B3I9 TaxID=3042270 RepID=UPI0027D8A2AE|nr:hypothetical protein [Arthrobacter sp. B3I9]